MGSWKIIAMLFPRIDRTSSSSILRTSWPSNMIEPWTIFPGGCAMRRMRESAVTVLPHPDSPTSPSVSPAASSNDTPSTACTTPSRVKNCVLRSRTSSSWPKRSPYASRSPAESSSISRLRRGDTLKAGGVRSSRINRSSLTLRSTNATLRLHARVQGVPQPVADEGEGQQHDRDAERRQKDRPRRRGEDHEALVDHRPPGRRGGPDADSKERQRGLGQHGAGYGERDRHDDRCERVGEQMPEHDAHRTRADGAGRFDE